MAIFRSSKIFSLPWTFLEKNDVVIRSMCQQRTAHNPFNSSMTDLQLEESLSSSMRNKVAHLKKEIDQALKNSGWSDKADKILSFGPRRSGPNVLINNTSQALPNVWSGPPSSEADWSSHLSSLINGFQLVAWLGPSVRNPWWASVSSWTRQIDKGKSNPQQQPYRPLSGQASCRPPKRAVVVPSRVNHNVWWRPSTAILFNLAESWSVSGINYYVRIYVHNFICV